MKRCLSAIILLIASLYLKAGDGDYSVLKIDSALRKKANAVKRFEEIRFEVIDLDKARYYHKYAITILNEKGDDFASMVEHYDKLQSVVSIDGKLYDAFGQKIKSLKNSDIQDRSASGDNNLADDNRVKFHNFYHRSYPYTIEYEIELKYNYTMFYPHWSPVDDEHMSVAYSSMTIRLPEKIDFRYKNFNVGEPVSSVDKSTKVYKWEIKNFAAIETEYKSPYWFELVPFVYMGPVQFQVEDYKGNMATWQDFGKFVYALKQGKDQLPDNIKQVVHSLVDGVADPKQKIEKLYSFMQENTRYISIQLGIGGWQPFDAAYVAQKKYGDCKALTNYMYSLLKEAGIKSYYTLIKAKYKSFVPEFPSSQFNHVILSVPLQKDTMWLECTSQTMAPGYLSDFTDDRYALLIDEDGGKLVRTPKYHLNENLQVRKINTEIDATGLATIAVDGFYEALQQDHLHGMIKSLSKDKVKEYLNDLFNLPNYELVSYDYKEIKSPLPVIKENLKLSAGNYATVSGKRLFVVPNILSRSSRKLSPDENRKYDLVENMEFRDIDTVEIKIPAGYRPESLPKDVLLQTKFGKYSATVKVQDDKITYYRLMEQYSGRFPAGEYNEFVKFYEQIYKTDRNKLVFVKQE